MAWGDVYAGVMAVEHRLRHLAWQQTEDGSKGRNPPSEMTPPPLVFDEREKREKAASKAELFLAQQEKIRRLREAKRAAQ